MSNNNIISTKRVAKNTVYLYARMLLMMILSLYTSRLLLSSLGVEDYGIYNVVAGFIVLFSFLQSAFSTSTTRFIGVAITNDNPEQEVSRVYYTAYAMHVALIVVLLIGLETVGLWYMNNYMNIPNERENVAILVFQLAVANVCLLTLRVPDNSLVIAFEKFNFFAVCGVVEAVMKLVIVILLFVSPIDKLISYSLLVLVVNLVINVIYFTYARYYLPIKIRYVPPQGKIVIEMFSLIGWNSLGGFANIGYQQGINLVLNFFYGVTLNAAMGIANQVKSAVYALVSNVRTASDPQIIKSYALSEFSFCRQLMSRISRLSHYLLILIAMPVIINVDFILELWLKNPPEYASKFVVLMLIYCILDGLMGPLWILNQATGKIKKYQVIRAIFYLSNIPVSILVMQIWAIPELIIIVGILITFILYIIQIPICINSIGMRFADYFKDVLSPVIAVTAISFVISLSCGIFISNEWLKLICTLLVNTLVLGSSVYMIGISADERNKVNIFLKTRVLRNK